MATLGPIPEQIVVCRAIGASGGFSHLHSIPYIQINLELAEGPDKGERVVERIYLRSCARILGITEDNEDEEGLARVAGMTFVAKLNHKSFPDVPKLFVYAMILRRLYIPFP